VTLSRSLSAVAVSTLVCTCVGVGAGAAIGRFCPDYYRIWFRPHSDCVVDYIQVGIGFGLNAGVFTGVFVGVAMVAIVGYFEMKVRLAKIQSGVENDG
jgi:hypothetical protein